MKNHSYLSNRVTKWGILMGLCGLSCLTTLSIAVAAPVENIMLNRIEKGEVIATKAGASFVVQGLVGKEFEKVAAALSDLSKLPSVFDNIGYARPYVSKGTDGRQFLYLKLRGLIDGLGVLMEVRSAGSDAFVNARELNVSGEVYKRREISADMDLSTDPAHLQLKREMAEASKNGAGGRDIGFLRGITLEGPLQPVMQLPNVRFTINLGVAPYTYYPASVAKTPTTAPVSKTYMVLKVGVGNQVSRGGELGDYRGFGDQRLTMASTMGEKVLGALRERLEKL